MKGRIIILGNGFDLAHGLKTSYGDFIEFIISESLKGNQKIKEEIVDLGYLNSEDANYYVIKREFNRLNHASQKPIGGKIHFTNNFFRSLLSKYFTANWVDIEDFYFKFMGNANSIEKLNEEFELVKTHLEDYLSKQQITETYNSRFYNEGFVNIFEENNPDSILFLNFNYTSTINLYWNSLFSIQEKSVVYIHGQLKSEENPIVFGYGDDSDTKYTSYLRNTNNSFLRNLKRQQYNLAPSYQNLKDYLNRFRNTLPIHQDEIEIYCIGHSLGLSDRTLLNEVFEQKLVKRIKLFYYKDREGYRELNNNISRIVSKNTLNNKVVNFPSSKKIPQIENSILAKKSI